MRYPFVLNAAAKAELMQADALFMKRVRLNIIVSLLHVVSVHNNYQKHAVLFVNI